MWRKLILGMALLSILPLGQGAAAQGGNLRVWYTLDGEDARAIGDTVGEVGAASGVNVSAERIEAPFLLQALLDLQQSGGEMPDLVFTGTDVAEPLLQNDLIAPMPARGDFFLFALLEALPGLLEEACRDEALDRCLWGGVSSALPLLPPDDKAVGRTIAWICDAAPLLPVCEGDSLPGLSVLWSFQIVLLNRQWLAERGLEPPVTFDDVLTLRSQFGLQVVRAEQDSLPSPGQVAPDAIVVFPSTVLVERPQQTLGSLGDFFSADYAPVLSLGLHSLYRLVGGPQPDLAQEFASAFARNTEAQMALLKNTSLLPALTPDDLLAWGAERPEARAVLGALVLLTAYAQTVY